MPSDVHVTGTEGQLHLTDLRDNCYEPVPLSNVGNVLIRGVESCRRGHARQWRWVLGGRELYVFVPGDKFRLHGFVSTSRLSLNVRHLILATERLRGQILAVLAKSGCADPEVNKPGRTPGVPQGWLLFRDVTPTRTPPTRHGETIPYALCPPHDVKPHFVGGVRLKHGIWLLGFPPRIHLSGEISAGYQVTIDGHPARPSTDGAWRRPAGTPRGSIVCGTVARQSYTSYAR